MAPLSRSIACCEANLKCQRNAERISLQAHINNLAGHFTQCTTCAIRGKVLAFLACNVRSLKEKKKKKKERKPLTMVCLTLHYGLN